MSTDRSTPPSDPLQDFALKLDAATPRVWVTPAIVAINIGVYLLMTAQGIDALGGRAEDYLRYGANFAPLTTGGEWWRLLTCTFLHFGVLHLALNMWALWDSGRITERLFGNGWFGALYVFSGLAGSCASMLWNQQAISAGASGAVFGVFGALLAYMTVQRGSVPEQVMTGLRFSTGIFVTYSLFYGFAKSGIDNAAHLGGLAAGYAMGLLMARPLAQGSRQTGNVRRLVLAALLAAATLPTASRLTPDTSRVYRQALALQDATVAFITEESRLVAALQSLVEQTRNRKMSDAAALRELRSNLIPAWDLAVERLGQVELDANAPLRRDYDLLLRYALARRDMTRAIADYVESNDAAHEKRVAILGEQMAEALRQYQLQQGK